nr:MAG TPA: hypothetical protein [Caudoviricetes sp.]
MINPSPKICCVLKKPPTNVDGFLMQKNPKNILLVKKTFDNSFSYVIV